jgi:hypothetical protein
LSVNFVSGYPSAASKINGQTNGHRDSDLPISIGFATSQMPGQSFPYGSDGGHDSCSLFSGPLTPSPSRSESPATATLEGSAGSVKITAGAAAGGALIAFAGLLLLLFFALRRRQQYSQIDEHNSVDAEFDMPGDDDIFDLEAINGDESDANPLSDSESDEEVFIEFDDCDERVGYESRLHCADDLGMHFDGEESYL